MHFPDDRLRLIFTCCHPALNQEAQVALTLRTLGGLTHAGNREGVPGRRSRRWRNGWCARNAKFRKREFPTKCRRRIACRSGWLRCRR